VTSLYEDFNLKTALEFLVTNKIVPKDVLTSDKTLVERQEIIDAILKGSDIVYEPLTDELYVFTEDGTKVLCSDLSEGMTNASKWISDYIPGVFLI
jgi:hypothetical protein